MQDMFHVSTVKYLLNNTYQLEQPPLELAEYLWNHFMNMNTK